MQGYIWKSWFIENPEGMGLNQMERGKEFIQADGKFLNLAGWTHDDIDTMNRTTQ